MANNENENNIINDLLIIIILNNNNVISVNRSYSNEIIFNLIIIFSNIMYVMY